MKEPEDHSSSTPTASSSSTNAAFANSSSTAEKVQKGRTPRDLLSGVQEKHGHIRGRAVISSIALGLSDGVISNTAFLAGFAGAESNLSIIRFAGFAAMIAGAVSMFFSGYNASRSENDLFRADSRREKKEIEEEPNEERMELMSFYMDKGLTEAEAEMVVNRITSDKEKWLDDILMHELHLHREKVETPLKSGAVIGLSFLLGAAVPLLAYLLFSLRSIAVVSSLATSLVFLFVAGGWKGKIAGRKFWRAGTELLLIGAAASALLFLIGTLLGYVVAG